MNINKIKNVTITFLSAIKTYTKKYSFKTFQSNKKKEKGKVKAFMPNTL